MLQGWFEGPISVIMEKLYHAVFVHWMLNVMHYILKIISKICRILSGWHDGWLGLVWFPLMFVLQMLFPTSSPSFLFPPLMFSELHQRGSSSWSWVRFGFCVHVKRVPWASEGCLKKYKIAEEKVQKKEVNYVTVRADSHHPPKLYLFGKRR